MTQNMTFTVGERLTASKMNQLVGMIDRTSSPTFSRPNGFGFKGETQWNCPEVNVQTPTNKPRFKPFDICPQWDGDGELSGYLVMRPMWHEYAALRQLSGDISIAHSQMDGVSSIYLCELSSMSNLSADNDRWIVIDDTQIGDFSSDPIIKNKWKLYDVDGGLIVNDYRDAFVQTGLSGSIGNPDLSSINWMTLSTEQGEEELSCFQIWNYAQPDAEKDIRYVKATWHDKSHDVPQPASVEISSEYSDDYLLMARPFNGGHVKYVQVSGVLSALSSDVDTESLDWLDLENADPTIISAMENCTKIAEIWHYNNLLTTDRIDIGGQDEEPLSELSAYRILARPNGGGTVKYIQLAIPEGMNLDLSSLDFLSSDEEMAQIYHWDIPREGDLVDAVDIAGDDGDSPSDLSVCIDQYRFLARPLTGGTAKYVQISGVLSALSVDVDLSSVNYVSDNGQLEGCDKVIQAWNYQSPTAQDRATVRVDDAGSYEFLARPLGGGTMKYIHLSADAGPQGGDITINGTDQTSHTGDTFTFESKSDSNVVVTVGSDGKLQIGVYWV